MERERLATPVPSERMHKKIVEYIFRHTEVEPTESQVSRCYQRYLEYYFLGSESLDGILDKEAERTNYWRIEDSVNMLDTHETAMEFVMYRDNLDSVGMRQQFSENRYGTSYTSRVYHRYVLPDVLLAAIKRNRRLLHRLGYSLCVIQHEPVAGYGYYGESLVLEHGVTYLEFYQSGVC